MGTCRTILFALHYASLNKSTVIMGAGRLAYENGKIWPCHPLIVCLLPNDLTFLCISFPIYRIRIILVVASSAVLRIK